MEGRWGGMARRPLVLVVTDDAERVAVGVGHAPLAADLQGQDRGTSGRQQGSQTTWVCLLELWSGLMSLWVQGTHDRAQGSTGRRAGWGRLSDRAQWR